MTNPISDYERNKALGLLKDENDPYSVRNLMDTRTGLSHSLLPSIEEVETGKTGTKDNFAVRFEKLMSFQQKWPIVGAGQAVLEVPCIRDLIFNHYLGLLHDEYMARDATKKHIEKLWESLGL